MQTLHFVEDSFRNLLNYPVTTSECCKRGTEENLGFPKHASGERWNSGILQSTKTLWMDFVCVCLIKLWMLNTAKKKKKTKKKKVLGCLVPNSAQFHFHPFSFNEFHSQKGTAKPFTKFSRNNIFSSVPGTGSLCSSPNTFSEVEVFVYCMHFSK